jgi:two-component system, OmpR family, sensor histidine kinase KdpD
MASKDPCRPDPDELLRQIQQQEAHDARGRLKIFLGYAPRVGKSMRMFDEGRRRIKRGQDVVIGAVQTKGSQDHDSMIREFEVVPPLRVSGAAAVDVEPILRRAPHVCLVDELASDNPPGSRNAHRWQDIEELRAHGINVVAAINLQHVAEQQDAVERITGRRASNSVPASFIHSADELVIVDVPPEELAQHGGGASNLKPDQLNELRELALLLAAQVVEEQLQRYMNAHGIMQSWGTQERILVCITPRSSARAMLESGARATKRFHGQMLTTYIKQGELSREAEETLHENLDYARKLGAEVHVLAGANPIEAILRFAREQRVTQLFIGHTQRNAWKFWPPNPVDRLIKAADGMDVRLFPHSQSA